MKTSNKIFIGFIAFIILLAISIILLLKSNLIPSDNIGVKYNRDYGMGDIDGIQSDGEFLIKPFLYNGDSWVKLNSQSPIPESFTVTKDDKDILILGTQNEETMNRDASVSVKMRECRFFDLGGGTQMKVDQNFKRESITFNLRDRANATVPVSADTLHLNLIDQSQISLKGSANVVILNVSGHSRIDAKDLDVNEAIVSLKDKSRVVLNVKENFSGIQEDESDFQNIGTAKGSVRRSTDTH